MKRRLLSIVATLGLLVGAIGFAPPASSALSCDPGFTETSATYEYYLYNHPNIINWSYLGYFYMRAVGCYNASTGQTEGISLGITLSGGASKSSYVTTLSEITAWTNGETDFRINKTFHSSYSDGWYYMRIKLKPTGEWYPGGWQYTCSFGAAGGWCQMPVTRIYF
jgi:hypothetical protein